MKPETVAPRKLFYEDQSVDRFSTEFNERIALKLPFENQSYRKLDFLALDPEVSQLEAADPLRCGMSRQCGVLAITTSTAPIEPEFTELITS